MTARFHDTISIIMLEQAWNKVKAKGTAGGVDDVTTNTFSANDLQRLFKDLKSGNYVPQPYLHAEIPKNETEKRTLGMLSVRDKVVQTAILSSIEDVISKNFLPTSYAYIRNRGPADASLAVFHVIKDKKMGWAARADIYQFFDHINLTLLESKLAEILQDTALIRLIMLCLKMGTVDRNHQWKERKTGIPQGGILSPLMANLYLTEFDRAFTNKEAAYFRYADDMILLCKTRNEATRLLSKIKELLHTTLHLWLNDKSHFIPINSGVEFLGITFYPHSYTLSKEKRTSLQRKIDEAIKVDKKLDGRKLKEVTDGIQRYYGRVLHEKELEFIDEHLLKTATLFAEEHKRYFKSKLQLKKAIEGLPLVTIKFKKQLHQHAQTIIGAVFHTHTHNQTTSILIDENALIKKKKREYQKLENKGLDLIIDKPGVFLGKTKGKFTVKEKGVILMEAPAINVKHISILSAGVSISGYVVQHCCENNVPVDFFNTAGKPIARIYGNDTTDVTTWQNQLQAITNGKGAKLAIAIVKGKIRNQINLIKYYSKYYQTNHEAFKGIWKENNLKMLDAIAYIDQLHEVNDLEVLRGQLFSAEGRAAGYYWDIIQTFMNDGSGFENRERKGATDLVNVMLNYGYGILYSRIWDAVLKADLNPYISYLHSAQDKKPTLTYDLIEPFRQQCVDKPVIALINKKEPMEVSNGLLTPTTKKRLTEKILERISTPEKYRGVTVPLSDIIKMQAVSYKHYINGDIKQFKPYALKW